MATPTCFLVNEIVHIYPRLSVIKVFIALPSYHWLHFFNALYTKYAITVIPSNTERRFWFYSKENKLVLLFWIVENVLRLIRYNGIANRLRIM